MFSDINISQRSVAMPLRCGGICNDIFIADFLLGVRMKEFKKRTTRVYSLLFEPPCTPSATLPEYDIDDPQKPRIQFSHRCSTSQSVIRFKCVFVLLLVFHISHSLILFHFLLF